MNTVQSSGTGSHQAHKKEQRIEDLVVSSPTERNWRGICIALLVIVAVLGLIIFSIVLVSPQDEGPRMKGHKPSLQDIFIKLPPPAKFNGTWISDTEFVFRDANGGITLYDVENNTLSTVLSNYSFKQLDAMDFKMSSDLRYILLISEITRVYTYTTLAKYYIYDIATRIKRPLSNNELDESAPFLQYATWSPDGTAVAFVYNNDIYYKPKVDRDLVCRITKSGVPNIIYNGIPDWLYENEILKVSHTVWFSPDSLYLLYITFNDTLVEEYKYSWYDSGNPKVTYPTIKSFRYPKVESPNPVVSVWIVNLTMPKYLFPLELKPTNSVAMDSYITSASYHGENNVAIVWLNRAQNMYVIITCRHKTNYNCYDFHIEEEHIGWTEPIYYPLFNYNSTRALVRLPVKDGNNDEHYMHACEIYNNKVRPLTHGAFEIIKVLAWDEENQFMYAIATNENSPGVRHLYRISVNSSSPEWTCITCKHLAESNMTHPLPSVQKLENDSMLMDYVCDFNNIIFSTKMKYYIQECLGPNVPVVFLVTTDTNTRHVVLDTSLKLKRKIRRISMPQIKTLSVEIEFGYKAKVKLYLPPVLREHEYVTFPLVLLVDASPSSQMVSSEWELSWPCYLASTRNYIVAKIDARGSGFQSIRMRRELQRRIGFIEVQDQLTILTYLTDTFKYIDKNRICISGKGYGGYVAAMMLLQDIHYIINCSISISPITNWKYYNSFFTEKFLGVPSKHMQEYDNSDLSTKAGNINKKKFLLIYGTADTKVTPLHSLMLTRALINQEILFQQLAYPDESHEFTTDTLLHMYKQIDLFFNDSFGPSVDEWTDDSSFFIR